MAPCSWHSLPTEMRLQVIDFLEPDHVKVFCKVNADTYSLCLPLLFQKINLPNYEALLAYLQHVPEYYHRYIRFLLICTKPVSRLNMRGCGQAQTVPLVKLLRLSTGVEQLTLHVYGSPAKDLASCFEHLTHLKSLHMSNCGDERTMPLSERLVVSIALSTPRLEDLTLDRVARSAAHASDLIGSYPYVPIVSGDEDVEDHPIVGSALCLPSLLQIPTLRSLRIRDTHLGDPLWATASCAAPLTILDLGTYHHISQDTSRLCIERIINNIEMHCDVEQLAINTPFESASFKQSHSPLKHLRHLCLTSFFPVDSMVDTLVTLAGSPIETLCIQCYEDDTADVCSSIEEFLNLRVESGLDVFYEHLKEIVISFVPIEGDMCIQTQTWPSMSLSCCNTLEAGHLESIKSFEEYCRDLGLKGSTKDGMSSLSGQCIINPGGAVMGGKDPMKSERQMDAPPIVDCR